MGAMEGEVATGSPGFVMAKAAVAARHRISTRSTVAVQMKPIRTKRIKYAYPCQRELEKIESTCRHRRYSSDARVCYRWRR